jgi:hypothetical protein
VQDQRATVEAQHAFAGSGWVARDHRVVTRSAYPSVLALCFGVVFWR